MCARAATGDSEPARLAAAAAVAASSADVSARIAAAVRAETERMRALHVSEQEAFRFVNDTRMRLTETRTVSSPYLITRCNRREVEEFANKALEEEQARMHAESSTEQSAFRQQVQDFAQRALEEEEAKLRAELAAEQEKLRAELEAMAQVRFRCHVASQIED